MKERIIGREKEIQRLDTIAASPRAEFVAIYGRRRVGKTFLISELFEDRMVFDVSGVMQGDASEQFVAFNQALVRYGYGGKTVENWMDAFFALEQMLTPVVAERPGRKVIFIDELPCFDISNTKFVNALAHFWNSWVSRQPNLMLVVCGSATSWMVKNIIDNHGGLHNRITHELHIHPLTLRHTEAYLQHLGCNWDRLSIAQIYMIMGGIPYYLNMISPTDSVSTAVDRLFFSTDASLHNEFHRLFKSLFKSAETYETIIALLARNKKGMTRNEIASALKKSTGGRLSEQLDNLVNCDFVRRYNVKSKKISSRDAIYQLVDFYSHFYFSFLNSPITDMHYWSNHMLSAATANWFGYAFERLCMSHVEQVKETLGIDRIACEYYSWRSNDPENRAQVDLLLERADRIINLCEIKYSSTPYVITKEEDMKLRTRIATFAAQTQTRLGISPVWITTMGIVQGKYSTGTTVITLDDLFQ